jgi:endoglucanase
VCCYRCCRCSGSDRARALVLLDHAKQLYSFGKRFPGIYSKVINTDGGYDSSAYEDDMAWGAVWLHRAVNLIEGTAAGYVH